MGSSRILILPEIDRWGFFISLSTPLSALPYYLLSASDPFSVLHSHWPLFGLDFGISLCAIGLPSSADLGCMAVLLS